jgi:hypothetical protein
MEARGIPVAVVANGYFETAVKAGARDNGIAALNIVAIDRNDFADAYGKATTGTPVPRAVWCDGLAAGIYAGVDVR